MRFAGAASPDLIKLIIAHFNDLDVDGDGVLTLAEICQMTRRRASTHVDAAINKAVRRASAGLNDILLHIEGLDEPASFGGDAALRDEQDDPSAPAEPVEQVTMTPFDVSDMDESVVKSDLPHKV